jgi:hypothetical protein
MAVASFSLLAVVVYVGAKSQVNLVIYHMREAQAQAIAEAGLEDALHELSLDSTFRATIQKAFEGGTYTVTMTSDSLPTITATGYSRKIFPVIGSAVKTVSVQTKFQPGNCPYALMATHDIDVDGVVNRYNPAQTLTPTTTEYIFGGHVHGNTGVSAGSCSTTTYRINGHVSMVSGLSSLTNCVAPPGTVSVTTLSVTAPTYTCPGGSCPNTSLNVASGSTVTLNAGTYEYNHITVSGVLSLNTSTGAVTIYYKGNFNTNTGCQINSSSKKPERVLIYATNPGNPVSLECSTALHGYIEGDAPQFTINQELYGHFCGKQVNVGTSGIVHYDGGGSIEHAGWAVGSGGSWQESFKRQ